MAGANEKKKLGKQIIPFVEEVSLVNSAANGEKVLLMKANDAPPELALFAGRDATPAAPASAQSPDLQEFMAAWRKVAGQ